ncbi:MAG: hypothetical protein IJO43_02395 [Bacilli bacterium]|nr:hypothetical protein [Bacilli bacterium]
MVKEDERELKTVINAAYFLVTNDIDLVERQKEDLRELNYRANIKRRNLRKSIERRETNVETIEIYSALEKELNGFAKDGYIPNDTIKRVFELLKIKEEEQGEYLKQILMFNLERFTLVNSRAKDGEQIIEMLEVTSTDLEKPEIALEQMQPIFEKHGYDISLLSNELIELLTRQGNLSKIDSIFESIKRNKLDFVSNSKESMPFLTNLLVYSNSDIIDEACKIFKDAHVDSKFIRNYKPIFFPSSDEVDDSKNITRRRNPSTIIDHGEKVEDSNRNKVIGRHRDFVENLNLLESLGYDRKFLLERQTAIITLPHSTLCRHLKELKLYEFPVDSGKFPLSTLGSYRIMEYTDAFIELGEEQYIYNFPSKLWGFRDAYFDRLYTFKKLGIPYQYETNGNPKLLQSVIDSDTSHGVTKEKVSSTVPRDAEVILRGNKYSELLDRCLPIEISQETLESSMVRQLDSKYKRTNATYDINGVLISRRKLLRNYEFLINTDLISSDEKDPEQILLVSAISKSRLSIAEIEKVNNGLNSCMVVGGGKDGILKKQGI